MKGTELGAHPKAQLNLGSEAGENIEEVLCGLASWCSDPAVQWCLSSIYPSLALMCSPSDKTLQSKIVKLLADNSPHHV